MSGGDQKKKTREEIVEYLRFLAELGFSQQKAEELRRVAEQERALLEQKTENFGQYSRQLGEQNFGFSKTEQWEKIQQAQKLLERKRRELGISPSKKHRTSRAKRRRLPSRFEKQELLDPIKKRNKQRVVPRGEKQSKNHGQQQDNHKPISQSKKTESWKCTRPANGPEANGKMKKRCQTPLKQPDSTITIEIQENIDRRINPYEEKIILCIASAAEHFKEWIRITQVAMLAILKVHLNARMSKPTLCKYLALLEEKGYIQRQRLIQAKGRGTMRKATCYRLLPLAMKVIERNAKLIKKLLKRFKKIRDHVKEWAKKLFGTETPIRVNPVEYLLSTGYTLLHLKKKRVCIARS